MNLGLRAKLTGSIALFMALLAAFLIFFTPWRQGNVSERSLKAHAKDTAFALGTALASEMLARDRGSAQDSIDLFGKSDGTQSDISYVHISLPDGAKLASWTDENSPSEPPVLTAPEADNPVRVTRNSDYLHVSVRIERAGQYLGVLHMGMSMSPVDDAIWRSRIEALVLGGVILLIGILVALLLGNSLTTPILKVADELEFVSGELATAARDQEASSAEEAAAVAQTRRSMETLLDSAQKIADRSSEVLGNAERSTNGSQLIASRIGNLNLLAERIADILASIMQVADKTDLLALNASLEGTRAGEAGKGFALVGAEMRRLAENVIESVAGIRELMAEMRELSQAAVSASQEGTNSSTATRHSAQEIAMLTQDQRKATEQVIASMDELGSILNLTLDGIQRTSASASKLTGLASTLSQVVDPESSSEDPDESEDSAA